MNAKLATILTVAMLIAARNCSAQGTIYANGSYTNEVGSPVVGGGGVLMRTANGLPPQTLGYPSRPGDVVLLFDLGGDLTRSNWSSVLHFFNPSDLTGQQGLSATQVQMFSASDPNENGFSDYQLFSNYIFVPEGPGGGGARANTLLHAYGSGNEETYLASDIVPEPGAVSLVSFGGIVLALQAVRSQKRD